MKRRIEELVMGYEGLWREVKEIKRRIKESMGDGTGASSANGISTVGSATNGGANTISSASTVNGINTVGSASSASNGISEKTRSGVSSVGTITEKSGTSSNNRICENTQSRINERITSIINENT